MKIAITADIHLTNLQKDPERYKALEFILVKSVNEKAGALIIAGDLFDKSCGEPGEVEKIFSKPEFVDLPIYIIPGNHDPAISEGMFSGKNIHFISKPGVFTLDRNKKFLFIPYNRHTSIAPQVFEGQYELEPEQWILVGHGDWLETNTPANNYENDQYMPLSRGDVQWLKPGKVFLGHIHAPYDSEIVHYPGSPYPLDVTETGFHSFLLYDCGTNRVERQLIDNDVVYQRITITVVPVDDETGMILSMLEKQIAQWNMPEAMFSRIKVRVDVQGYSSNRDEVRKIIEDSLKSRGITLESPPELSKLKVSNDKMRADIALETKEQILGLHLQELVDEPGIDDYLAEALNIIYKG